MAAHADRRIATRSLSQNAVRTAVAAVPALVVPAFAQSNPHDAAELFRAAITADPSSERAQHEP